MNWWFLHIKPAEKKCFDTARLIFHSLGKFSVLEILQVKYGKIFKINKMPTRFSFFLYLFGFAWKEYLPVSRNMFHHGQIIS